MVAVALLGWAVTTELLVERAILRVTLFDNSGFNTGPSYQAAEYQLGIDRFAFVVRFLSIALGIFGPLLLVWSLLL